MSWLAKVLPTIGTALVGPLGGIAASFVAEKLGLEDSTVEAVQAAISGASPDTMLKLKEIDADLQKYFAGLGVKLEEIAAADRVSARDREVKTGDSWTLRVLAAVIVGGFFATVYMVLSGYVSGLKDPIMATTIGTLIGYVSAKADQIVSYYFGSSAGSKEKNELLYKSRPEGK